MEKKTSAAKLASLAAARAILIAKQTPCPHCEKLFCCAGIAAHIRACYLSPEHRRECKVCGKPVKNYKAAITCGFGCANTLFRSGSNHGNWKPSHYRSTCFEKHDKICVICGETNIVGVHHLNGDRNDNRVENLVPLCPTHHQYWHSRFRWMVEERIMAYVEDKFGQRGAIRTREPLPSEGSALPD